MWTNQIRIAKALTRLLKVTLLKVITRKTLHLNTVSEIQTSDSDQDTEIDKNDSDSMGWNNLPDMVMTPDNSDTSGTDGTEWLNEFYEQNHIISNLEYAKLRLPNFAVKIFKTMPITALFDTGVTCSCISKQVFKKIVDKINLIRKPLKLNTASGGTSGPIGIAPLDLNIEQYFAHNFTMCTKLKQHLILGLELAQR